MKFVSFVEWNNTESVGILSKDGNKVIAINEIISDFKFDSNPMIQLINMINTDKDILNKLKYAEENFERAYSIDNVKILSPIRKPIHDIICVGVNYSDHLSEIKKDMKDFKEVKAPVYFSKRAIEIIGFGDKIKSRFDLDECLDYEVELAVIMGKTAKDIKPEEVNDYIFGYSIFNDISSRNIQKKHSQWYKGKSLDSYSAMGPCIVYKDDLKLPLKLDIKSILNDEIRQSSNTKYMIHDVNYLISDISRGMTLETGDIIATGTPGGVGMSFNPPKYMKKGDKIICSIENIGELINFAE
ncbi:fumarylacetoacetate hydrolase family protein [Brachyspira hampsonii]|uniref:Fumarylacetoacetate (FAA) hydrolase family protein n=1 Tax=Brachyspira hampsonii 30446 TaxID=1289135 RepID=A0A2U4F1F9_9SPIR|nr:fumarylacetoacetate hydrolase family protein [Brachyspira hampsonii]EKV58162.1 Fumarylacetoacetate (FAA) hydrolase family protein [Brachyspira hampsonii 30446]MBW5389978.1 FAA hydrolase family protein [Brachyspira hampsonii]MBW5395322.1 FAA hydrolase family protein [Brachyspira hampsonii]OEJ19992.1 hydrolase [Brachyspira hampsonii]